MYNLFLFPAIFVYFMGVVFLAYLEEDYRDGCLVVYIAFGFLLLIAVSLLSAIGKW